MRAEPEVTQLLTARGQMTPEEAAEAAIPFIYDAGTPRTRIDEDLAVRRPWFPRPEAYMNQLMGIFAWEAFSRLDQIKTGIRQRQEHNVGDRGFAPIPATECSRHDALRGLSDHGLRTCRVA